MTDTLEREPKNKRDQLFFECVEALRLVHDKVLSEYHSRDSYVRRQVEAVLAKCTPDEIARFQFKQNLTAEVTLLRQTLEPFAAIADDFDHESWDGSDTLQWHTELTGHLVCEIKVDAFRAARSAIECEPEKNQSTLNPLDNTQ